MLYYIFLLFCKTVNLKISIKNIVLIKKLGNTGILVNLFR